MNGIDPRRVNLNNPFLALKHKNFRYYSMGMIISLLGTWMQNIAQPWLAYSLTKSPLLLSLVGAMQFMPVLLFSLFAGVIIDQYPKKRILIFTQSASLVITLALAILVWSGQVRYWHILVLSAVLGFANTLDMPTRQSFVIELVGQDDLTNAIALNSTIFNLTRIAGPAIAGLIMAATGPAICFFINSISFAAVLVSLVFIRPIALSQKKAVSRHVLADIREGLEYIRQRPVLFQTLLAIAIVGTFAPNFSVLVPVFATQILNLQEAGFGLLMSFLGLGSLVGAMYIAASSRKGPMRYMLSIVPFFVGIFLAATGFTSTFMQTALMLALTGFFFVAFTSSANSTLQLNSSHEFRGRVMSTYALVFGGSTPIGNLYAGFISEHVDARMGFAACGLAIIILMIVMAFFAKRKQVNQNEETYP